MKIMKRLLQWLGITEAFSGDDVINASTEDAARDHSSIVEQLHESIKKRVQGNEALRQSIFVAKQRTNSFAEFEQRIRRESHANVRRRE
jgi:hypothetical protein